MAGAADRSGFPAEMRRMRTSDYDPTQTAGEECEGDPEQGVAVLRVLHKTM